MKNMDIWEIGKIDRFKVIHIRNDIMLHRIESNQINQELYFDIENQDNVWNTYVVQRGRRTIKYTSSIYEFSEASACLLFHKYFMCHFPVYNWEKIDVLIDENHIIEAKNVINRDTFIADENEEKVKIKLEKCGAVIDIIYNDNNERFVLATCSDYHQALRAYRNYRLMFIRFQIVFNNFVHYFPHIDTEYMTLIKIFLI